MMTAFTAALKDYLIGMGVPDDRDGAAQRRGSDFFHPMTRARSCGRLNVGARPTLLSVGHLIERGSPPGGRGDGSTLPAWSC